MPEVKLHNVKATIIGSSWLSPLREIEIQLTFNGIVMEFQLSLLWLCACLSQEWYGSHKRKGSETAGKISAIILGQTGGEWGIPYIGIDFNVPQSP